jgi:hypothetical protein
VSKVQENCVYSRNGVTCLQNLHTLHFTGASPDHHTLSTKNTSEEIGGRGSSRFSVLGEAYRSLTDIYPLGHQLTSL